MKEHSLNAVLQAKTREIAPDVYHSYYETIQEPSEEGEGWVVEYDTFDTELCVGLARFARSEWKSEVIENPTMADALRAMQRSIEATGDRHHVFFEGLATGAVDDRGIRTFRIITGS